MNQIRKKMQGITGKGGVSQTAGQRKGIGGGSLAKVTRQTVQKKAPPPYDQRKKKTRVKFSQGGEKGNRVKRAVG